MVRHAKAVQALPGEPDSERALSPEGRAAFEVQLVRLESMGFSCDQLWTSPWRRARETAALFGARIGTPPQDRKGLCSDLDTQAGEELIADAKAAARDSRVVLVGHQPWLGELARQLGAAEVSDLECGEVLWLTRRTARQWIVAARLRPS